MSFSINNVANSESYGLYYKNEIRVLLESHVEFIKNHSSTTVERVMSSLTYKYEGDFYGLLMALKIPIEYHWITMRINGYSSPTEMSGEKIAFLKPDFTLIEQIINIHRSANSVNK